MRYRLLGRTGLYVSELCLGTMTYGGKGFWEVMGGLQQEAVDAQVKYAFEAASISSIQPMSIRSANRKSCWGRRSRPWACRATNS